MRYVVAAIAALALGCLAALLTGWLTYDRPALTFCRAAEGVPNYFPCRHQPRAHVRIVPTTGAGLLAVLVGLVVVVVIARLHAARNR